MKGIAAKRLEPLSCAPARGRTNKVPEPSSNAQIASVNINPPNDAEQRK